MQSWSFPLILLGLAFVLLGLLSWWQPRALFAVAQWSCMVVNLEEDADRFYGRLFALLEARLEARPLPFASLSLGPQPLWATRTLLGGEALYLEARYRHLTYYVYACAMPGGLFVSTWLFSKMAGWEEHPLLKWLLLWRLYQMTLFGFDCLEMFHLTVHGAVLDLLDDYVRERGLAPLDEVARRPVLHGFYARRKGVGTLPNQPVSGAMPLSPAPARLPFEAPNGSSAASAVSASTVSAPALPFERGGTGHSQRSSSSANNGTGDAGKAL